MSPIGNVSIRLKLREEEVGSYKGKHFLSCNCQPPPPSPHHKRGFTGYEKEETFRTRGALFLKSKEEKGEKSMLARARGKEKKETATNDCGN